MHSYPLFFQSPILGSLNVTSQNFRLIFYSHSLLIFPKSTTFSLCLRYTFRFSDLKSRHSSSKSVNTHPYDFTILKLSSSVIEFFLFFFKLNHPEVFISANLPEVYYSFQGPTFWREKQHGVLEL